MPYLPDPADIVEEKTEKGYLLSITFEDEYYSDEVIINEDMIKECGTPFTDIGDTNGFEEFRSGLIEGEIEWGKRCLINQIEKRKLALPFECEMGYTDCVKRGYCNGDC